MMKLFDRLVLAAVLLTLCVVVLGAYVRLSDAGLGCPDWPGCYGHLTVPQSDSALAHVEKAFPGKTFESHKAWKEMVHRYFAGTLGLLILAIFITAWRNRRRMHIPTGLPTVLLLVVAFQAALGMWTVTMLLKPVIVSAHLIGGMTTLALLTWLAHRRFGTLPSIYGANFNTLRPWARLGLVVLAVQIFLGGWTSSNYAALACTDFPACQGSLFPTMDFANAFHMIRELGETANGDQLSLAALTAIHWTHRLGALVTFLYLGWLAYKAMRMPGIADLGVVIAGLLVTQVALGISNVMFSLPLPVAVAHNAVAALLLISLVVLNSKTTMKSGR
jgi:cytochrome c oxidase assembly protein subunit 15